MYFCILGSHPAISLAELRRAIPKIKNLLIIDQMAVFDCSDWQDDVLMNRLGGTVKLGTVILQSKLSNLDAELIADAIAKQSPDTDSRSLDFGLTIYATKSIKKKLFKLPVQIKKELKQKGYSTRWVTGKGGGPLSPAAVAKCKLCEKPNADLCILIDNNDAFIGKTTQVQDADAWSLRDYGRPFRDSLNGMLPPKLARIMINLAQVPDQGTILDPFCGSGTILMEAALATKAKKIIGSDIEKRQIFETQKNTDWMLAKNILRPDDENRFRLINTDVKKISDHLKPKSIDAIVSEGWLGPPLKGNEPQAVLDKNTEAVTELWLDALSGLKSLLKPKSTLVIITPQYRTRHARASVDLTRYLNSLGYSPLDSRFQIPDAGLLYGRPNQFVERKILIIQPK
ncbi:MAG: TRM11 family SAM-dependent methyltransferase [Patescibacteria group bacterium]